MKNTQHYYTFQYPNGKIVQQGGIGGVCISDLDIDHSQTKVGDVVNIYQFNFQGSIPMPATIIGKVSYDWDMSKPIGQRMSNLFIDGVGYGLYK